MVVISKDRRAALQSRIRPSLARAHSTLITLALIFLVLASTGHLVVSANPDPITLTQTFTRVVHLSPPGPNDSRYAYIPFDVPAHAVRISISYQYDRAGGANTIDIGLFDARSSGSDTDPRGFRGWSGGRRSELFISRAEATPGYLRGDLPAGKWRIILGLYRVAPGGVDVTYKIDIETTETRSSNRTLAQPGNSSSSAAASTARVAKGNSPPPPTRKRAGGRGARWWTGDLHMHTVHSDGNWTIAELISSARNSGLDFIVITDHNTASHHEEINRLSKRLHQPLVLRGEEITTYGGHTNAWGLPSGTWIDFRTHPGDTSRISQIAAQAHRAGAVISINHPFVLCGGCSWSYDSAARDFDAIEVWNGPWDFTDEPALKMWDKILQSGRRITAIASSDSHRPDAPIGKPATHLAARVLTQAALLEALRQGHVYLTSEAAATTVSFYAESVNSKGRSRAFIGDEIRLIARGKIRFFISTEGTQPGTAISLISNGQVVRSFPASTDGRPEVIEIDCERNSYFRIEVRDGENAMLTLTNPIYVRIN
jgi:hypothetical protein